LVLVVLPLTGLAFAQSGSGQTAPGSSSTGPTVRLLPPQFAEQAASDRPDMVLRWNELLLQTVRADGTPPPLAARNMALVHIAIYDAVNAIERTYRPYRVSVVPVPGASPQAAAAAAAHGVLVRLSPRQKTALDAALAAALAEVSDRAARDAGANVGRFVAGQILAWRIADGTERQDTHLPGEGPGVWRPTPPAFRSALL